MVQDKGEFLPRTTPRPADCVRDVNHADIALYQRSFPKRRCLKDAYDTL